MTGRTVSKLLNHRKIFALEAPEMPDNLVPHPRFGTTVKRSAVTVTSDDIKRSRSLSSLRPGTFWPETAIRANPNGQSAYFGAHDWYVDLLATCGSCRRPFILYAREQQYFHEVLFVHPDIPCSYCVPCRKVRRDARNRNRRAERSLASIANVSGALTESAISDTALIDLAEDLLARNEHVFKNVALLGRVRRTLIKRPGLADQDRLRDLLGRLDGRIARMLSTETGRTINRPRPKP